MTKKQENDTFIRKGDVVSTSPFGVKGGMKMAFTLEQIYLIEKDRFHMKLVAGVYGIKASVAWVHMVETPELIPFLKRRELVITTGIRNMNEGDLLEFAKGLKEKDVAGLIINVGPYIGQVPPELMEYCDEVGFPLFTLPWETRLVEFSQDTCRRIFEEENTGENIAEAFLDGMLFPEKQKECQNVLARNGFPVNTEYKLFAMRAVGGEKENAAQVLDDLYFQVERILNRINGHYIMVRQNQILYVVTADYKKEEWKLLLNRIDEMKLNYGYTCFCGVTPETDRFARLAQYFERCEILLRLAVKRNNRITYYENLEVYKLLLSVNNMDILMEFCDKVIGKLKNYDKANHTDSLSLLRQYFSYNGCIQQIAEDNYVHRNTIHYQLGKIEKILGVDLENWEDRLKIHLCLLAEDIL